MKTIKFLFIQFIAVIILSLSSCDLTTFPWADLPDDAIGTDLIDFQRLTAGAYAQVLHSESFRAKHFMGEYTGDNVALSGNTGDNFRYSYNYEHIKNSTIMRDMWRNAYRVIYTTNGVIENVEDNTNDWRLLELKAECLFIRAEQHFILVQTFGLPYQKSPETNLGIPLMDKRSDEPQARATLKESWDFVVNDLLHAIRLFNRCKELPPINNIRYERKNCNYASAEVCEAFLARLYLYMDRNNEAMEYADKIINSGLWEVADAEAHYTYPTRAPENNKETIYAFRHTPSEDRDRDAIGSMYWDVAGSGWGQVYASQTYYDLVRTFPDDIRNNFIVPQYSADGELLYRNSVPRYYINKFSYQEGNVNLSSPVFLRIEEMYMIKAEIYAKTGRDQEAIDLVNMIRQKRGLSGDALYSVSDLKWNATVLDVVLEERRLEFAFEAHRKWDIFRNNRNLERHYPGYHQRIDDTSGPNNNFDMLVLHTNPRLAHYMPESEMQLPGNKLVDNP